MVQWVRSRRRDILKVHQLVQKNESAFSIHCKTMKLSQLGLERKPEPSIFENSLGSNGGLLIYLSPGAIFV